ncbi:MAG: sulfatase-like hydrolase/transferase [Magnetococcales bacterium]|nr:sulfatase-like hydrolase/transferase [Magnetococcales bacterium]
MMQKLLATRFGGLYLYGVLFVVLAFVIRLVLFAGAIDDLELSVSAILRIFATGLFYDLVAFSYFSILFTFYLMLVPNRMFRHPAHRVFYQFLYFVSIYILIFNGVSEWIFWDEFGVRYNFIAVDYLVYTTEVIGNIRQSYPVPTLLTAILLATVGIWWLIRKKGWLLPAFAAEQTLRERAWHGGLLLIAPLVFYAAVDHSLAESNRNRFHAELAKNGIYAIFSAFLNNELEFDRFYLKLEEREAFARVRKLLSGPQAPLMSRDDPLDITRAVRYEGAEKRLNVIYLTIESMSAEYMALFGNRGGLTPNMDRIAQESLTFTSLYATGTRTDRGMESIVLSIPPTPGRSKVKRPNNEDLFSVGFLFKQRGYDTRFIYGGYGYFDNMNYFFSHNGFGVVDRTQLDASEITMENVWGVADEDLFRRVIKEADRAHDASKPFFHFVMTTSNHRPFTYPEGRIDIPSPGGREGGVKYTDWAIGKFLEQARGRPWFDDTLFVIMADHCAGSAGKTELPVVKYHIPLMIYAPRHIAPRMVDFLTSQVDITPTVMGLLNWSHASRFFGQDVLRSAPESRRAFIGTYQKLGYINGNFLTVLSPLQKSSYYRFERGIGRERQERIAQVDEEALKATIAFYQTANSMRLRGLDKRIP